MEGIKKQTCARPFKKSSFVKNKRGNRGTFKKLNKMARKSRECFKHNYQHKKVFCFLFLMKFILTVSKRNGAKIWQGWNFIEKQGI